MKEFIDKIIREWESLHKNTLICFRIIDKPEPRDIQCISITGPIKNPTGVTRGIMLQRRIKLENSMHYSLNHPSELSEKKKKCVIMWDFNKRDIYCRAYIVSTKISLVCLNIIDFSQTKGIVPIRYV